MGTVLDRVAQKYEGERPNDGGQGGFEVVAGTLQGSRLVTHFSNCQRRTARVKAAELYGMLCALRAQIKDQDKWRAQESHPPIAALVAIVRSFGGRARKKSLKSDRPQLLQELARLVWQRAHDDAPDQPASERDDGCDDDWLPQPSGEAGSRQFLASAAGRHELKTMEKEARAAAEAQTEAGAGAGEATLTAAKAAARAEKRAVSEAAKAAARAEKRAVSEAAKAAARAEKRAVSEAAKAAARAEKRAVSEAAKAAARAEKLEERVREAVVRSVLRNLIGTLEESERAAERETREAERAAWQAAHRKRWQAEREAEGKRREAERGAKRRAAHNERALAARAQHARAAAARDEAALRVRAAKRPRTQADAEGEAAAKRLANTQRQRRLADAPEGQAAARRPAAATTPLTSAEARQQAEAEGLTLTLTKVQSATAKSATGFYGVRRKPPGRPRPYAAEVRRGGKNVSLGSFATAEEAALCVARSPEGQAAARRPAAATTPLTSAEARQQAEAEGLTLTLTKVQSATAKSATGFYGVRRKPPGRPRPYAAEVWRGGKTVSLGSFATAEEAALCVARSPEGQAAARRPAAARRR